MEIGDTDFDIEIGFEEDDANRNNDPVDADFDVICVDDDDDDEDTSINDGLPPNLLSAFKKDAAEAAEAAAANRKPEENAMAAEFFYPSAPAALSSNIKSSAYKVVTNAENATSAANETFPVLHQNYPAADKTSTASNQITAANQSTAANQITAADKTSTAADQTSTAANQIPAADETSTATNQSTAADKTSTTANQTSAAGNQITAADKTSTAANQTSTTANKVISDAPNAIPATKPILSAADHTAENQASTAAYKLAPGTQNTIPTAHQRSTAAENTILTGRNNPACFSVSPAVRSPIPSADSAATVLQKSDASTAACNTVQSYVQPPQMPAATQKDYGFNVIVTGGLRNELIFKNSVPLDDEWSALETELILPGKETQSQIATTQEATIVNIKPVITFEEAFEYLQSADMSDVKDTIQPSIERHGLSALTHYLFGPPKLNVTLLPSKEMTFCMAATTFDNDNSVHVRALLALYRNLTSCLQDCRRFGNHWETIGFQGNDPSTDLRGVGVFGLLQLLYITSQPQLTTLKKQIYKLSLHKTQNFPFCVMGLNLSKMVLQMLREDRLNRLCNKRGDLMSIVNEAFAACYYKVYHVWKTQNKTIVDSGFILKDVENQLRRSAPSLIKELEEYLKNGNVSVFKSKVSKSATDKLDNFVGVADILNK